MYRFSGHVVIRSIFHAEMSERDKLRVTLHFTVLGKRGVLGQVTASESLGDDRVVTRVYRRATCTLP